MTDCGCDKARAELEEYFRNEICRTDAAEIRAHLETRLASFKHPKQIVVVESIPRTSSGKPLRRVLADSLTGRTHA